MEEKITCKVCGFTGHNLKNHFVGGLNATCSVSLNEYQIRYSEEPIFSKLFETKLAELIAQQKAEVTPALDFNLVPKAYDIKKTFGLDMGIMERVSGFEKRHEMVPEIDHEYKFPNEATKIALIGIQLNKPTMIHGPTGTGKTTLVEQIAARINYPVLRINHHADMYSCDITGQMKAMDGNTVFEYGPLPFAMKRPVLLLMDEWDAINPEIGMLYQPVLERKQNTLGNLVLTAAGCEKVDSHQSFRIIATSNTCGLGDDKGHYQGTQIQNLAFVSRFQLRVRLDYLDKKLEMEILKSKFPKLEKNELESFTETAKKIREQYEAGKIDVPFSLRDLINWAELYYMLGVPQDSIKYTCTSVLPYSDAKTISEIVQRIWGEI